MWRDTAVALRGQRSRERTAKVWRRSWILGPPRSNEPRSPMERVNLQEDGDDRGIGYRLAGVADQQGGAFGGHAQSDRQIGVQRAAGLTGGAGAVGSS